MRPAFPIRFSERYYDRPRRHQQPRRNDSNYVFLFVPNYPYPITTNMYAFSVKLSAGTLIPIQFMLLHTRRDFDSRLHRCSPSFWELTTREEREHLKT